MRAARAQGERFPYDIAVRMQTRELLVFDDPLALSACHFCAIPTSCWAADWRMLLRAPAEGERPSCLCAA